MRDFLVILIIFGSVPVILMRPHVGIIMWSWVSYMNPHRLTWGIAYDWPVALTVGLATIIAWLISRENKKLPLDTISVLMLLYVLWTGFTTLFALEPDMAFEKWSTFNKTMLMVFLAIILMQSRGRLKALIWITCISIGYFSVKGGVFTALTGGHFRVWGPPQSYIEDNNALALATLMVVPLMYYLGVTAANRWVRYAMYAAITLSVVSVIGSYSRGGLLGLSAMIVFLWWRTRQRWLIGAALAMSILFLLPMVPQKWFDRMDTIQNYEEDASAMSRLQIWGFALDLAAERPILGGGFNVFQGGTRAYNLLGSHIQPRNVHSIYFEVLGEHGVFGLLLFLGLGVAGLRTNKWVRLRTKDKPEFTHAYHLASMLQVSLISFAVAGTFQNLAHFDLYYALLAMGLLNRLVVTQEIKDAEAAAAAPVEKAPSRISRPTGVLGVQGHRGIPSFLRPSVK